METRCLCVEKARLAERKGPTRFQSRVYDGIFVIKRKVSPTTFVVEDLVDEEYVPKFLQPFTQKDWFGWTCPSWDCSQGNRGGSR